MSELGIKCISVYRQPLLFCYFLAIPMFLSLLLIFLSTCLFTIIMTALKPYILHQKKEWCQANHAIILTLHLNMHSKNLLPRSEVVMFCLLHSITNKEQYEKNLCNQSSCHGNMNSIIATVVNAATGSCITIS